MKNEIIPRRIQLNEMTPEEKSISQVIDMIERLPADRRLTHALVALAKAKDHVGDFVDKIERDDTKNENGLDSNSVIVTKDFLSRIRTRIISLESSERSAYEKLRIFEGMLTMFQTSTHTGGSMSINGVLDDLNSLIEQ